MLFFYVTKSLNLIWQPVVVPVVQDTWCIDVESGQVSCQGEGCVLQIRPRSVRPEHIHACDIPWNLLSFSMP